MALFCSARACVRRARKKDYLRETRLASSSERFSAASSFKVVGYNFPLSTKCNIFSHLPAPKQTRVYHRFYFSLFLTLTLSWFERRRSVREKHRNAGWRITIRERIEFYFFSSAHFSLVSRREFLRVHIYARRPFRAREMGDDISTSANFGARL